NVQHLAGAGRFGKTREQGLFFEQRHVLVVASAIRLGLERLDAAVVISHVRAVHRTQRHAHCSRNRRLRHPTLTQQHHLDALALCGRYLPPQRSFQPSHLGFAAFDHLFPPESDGPSESQLGDEKQLAKQSLPLKKLDSSRYRGGIREAQRLSESPEIGVAHRVFGITCWFNGDYVSARVHLEQAVAAYDHERDCHLASRFGYDPGVVAMFFLGLVLWPLGEVDRAARLAEEALSLAVRSDTVPTVACAHCYTCIFAAIRRKSDRATEHASALLTLAREHELPAWLMHGIFLHGWARCCNSDPEASTEMREGLALARKLDIGLWLSLYGTIVAEVEADAGLVEGGLATLDAQLLEVERTEERWFVAEMHRVRGELLLKVQPPDVAAAESAFLRAIEIARSQQARTFELRATLSLAKLYQTTDRNQAASELLVAALAGFGASPELPEVGEAQRLMRLSAT